MQNAGGLQRFDEFSILLGKRKRSRRGYASCTFLAPHFEYFRDIDLIEGFSYVADLWDRTHMQLFVDCREQRFCLRNFQIEVCHCFESQRGVFLSARTPAAMGDEAKKSEPLFSFGVIADVQYADKQDGGIEGRVQRYREAPGKLDTAVGAFNTLKSNLSFVLTLGDIIDGNDTIERTSSDFGVVLNGLSKLEVPTYNLLGNHCLSLPRELIVKKLGMPAPFYRADLHSGWALVILDSMDMSVRWPEGTKNYKEATAFMEEHPLGEEHPQMSVWNGGLGSDHKAWFAQILSEAARDGTRLIVAAHHPIVVGSAPPTHLLWNHEEVTNMLVNSPAVALYLNGHYHPGGYAQVGAKHFVTLEAILEAPTNSEAHGLVHVFDKEIIIEGFGTVTSRQLKLD